MAASARIPKERLDRLLVSQGLAVSREIAARTVLAGGVLVDGIVVDKPAKLVSPHSRIDIEKPASFVSRSGEKLAAALEPFSIGPEGTICLDVGCSTGGFTDCLLQRGARRVYAVDVGYGQIDWKLRQDPRVILLERTNIRYLDRSLIQDPIDLAVIDVSFISLTLVLPSVVRFLRDGARVVALVKPQFEVGKGQVGAGGIVRDDVQRRAVTKKVIDSAAQLGLKSDGSLDSPVKGRKGNREILVAFEYRSKMSLPLKQSGT
ncbi:MAG: TlyA family rRNA (cytidine-2'-O)-methyltransferase [Nitrospira sp. CR1.3]|nr:TlyA family rRNA (cytidine-2'-O)-methyltransferase [Nitrospira sp. CR1.3]